MFFTEAGLWVAGKALEHGAETLFGERNAIKALLSSAWQRLFNGKTVVVISGLGGAGKTNLQKILSGKKSLRDLDPTYRVSINNEKTHLKDQYFVKLFTSPGQVDNLKFNEDEIKTQIMSADRIVFISVVTYGYNALHNVELKSIDGFDANNSLEETASAYFDLQRRKEVERLRDFIKLLDAVPAGRKIEIITVVNKLDLWWNSRHLVEKHYSQSEYGNVIKKLINDKNASFVRHSLVSVCLILSNIRTADDKVLAHPAPGFDIVLQNRNFVNFVDGIEKFLGAS